MVHQFLNYLPNNYDIYIGFIFTYIIDHTVLPNKLSPNNIVTAFFPNTEVFGVFHDNNQYKTSLGYIIKNNDGTYRTIAINDFGYTEQQPFKYFKTYDEVLIELWNLVQLIEFNI